VLLIVLSFIAPSVQDDKSVSEVFKDGFYNYITCLDDSKNYLVENVPIFSKLAKISYEKSYTKVMENRYFVKHLVSSGETIDDIIKSYNANIDDIESFREVIYKENPQVISDEYQVQSGEYLTVPSE
jgi:hypothetical protein